MIFIDHNNIQKLSNCIGKHNSKTDIVLEIKYDYCLLQFFPKDICSMLIDYINDIANIKVVSNISKINKYISFSIENTVINFNKLTCIFDYTYILSNKRLLCTSTNYISLNDVFVYNNNTINDIIDTCTNKTIKHDLPIDQTSLYILSMIHRKIVNTIAFLET